MKNKYETNLNKIKKSNYTYSKKLKKCENEELEDLPEKFEVNKIEKTHQPEKIKLYELGDDQKNLRQKAFNLMKKKVINKEEINKLSKSNFDNEPLNKKISETVYYNNNNDNDNDNEDNFSRKKFNSNNYQKDLAEKYNNYYNENFDPKEKALIIKHDNNDSFNNEIYRSAKEKNQKDAFTNNDDIINIIERNINNYKISQKYCLGIDIDISLNNTFCFHKIHKWFAYVFNNKIIIEDFSNNEDYRSQIFFEDSKYKLSVIKISPNNNYLISFSVNSFLIDKETDKEFDFSDLSSYNVFEEESFQNKNRTINSQNKKVSKIKINPHIFIWDIKDFLISDEIPKYKNITKLSIKHNKILDVEFSPQNNLCIFSSSNNSKENFISVLDFLQNEIIVTTLSNYENVKVLFNPYLRNLEFASLADNMFTFWRINLDASLQYQLGEFDKKILKENVIFTSMEYSPPLSSSRSVLLLLALNNFEIWGSDTKTNCIVVKFPSKYFYDFNLNLKGFDLFSERSNNIQIKENDTDTDNENIKNNEINKPINLQNSIRFIISSMKFVIIIYSNVLKIFKLPAKLHELPFDDLNIFTAKPVEVFVDSDIIAYDMDILDENNFAVVLTKKGNLWGTNFLDGSTIRIFSFLPELQNSNFPLEEFNENKSKLNNTFLADNDINQLEKIHLNNENLILMCKLICKNYQSYSLKNIDFNDLKIEDCSPEIKENEHFFITGHKNGTIKIWSIPEYSLIINFEVCTEDLICFETTPNDLKLVASYAEKKSNKNIPFSQHKESINNEGCLRFFDISKEKLLGKYKVISAEAFKIIKFLPDGNYFFAVDLKNAVYLIKIESYDPLLLQVHQIVNFDSDVISFELSPLDSYSKFLVNLQNVELHVFNRKFTNVLRNLSYDSSVPQFNLMDKFEFNSHFKNEFENNNTEKLNKEGKELRGKVYEKLNSNNNTNTNMRFNKENSTLKNFGVEFFLTNFCFRNKNYVYILSHARKYLTLRDFEKHVILLNLPLLKNPIAFSISPNYGYIVILFRDSFKVNDPLEDKGIIYKSAIERPVGINISQNGKIIAINSTNKVSFFEIKYE